MLPNKRQPVRVLALEDEALISMAIEGTLRDAGYAVHSVSTSDQALALLDTQQFDAAIIDIGLFAGDSHTVAEALSSKRVPFVFCTASNIPIEVPYVDVPVLDKPFSDTALLAVLARLVAQ